VANEIDADGSSGHGEDRDVASRTNSDHSSECIFSSLFR
jgi:hypothetical protein